jgi:hypothetical protein
MKYTEVKDAHIVPRVYLKRFAIEEALMLVIDGKALEKPISIDSAAIRKRFYRRIRPDGTPIDDVEWSLSQLEGGIASTLQSVRDCWPLPLEGGKAPLSEFFAMQLVRGPRWKTWLEQRVRKMVGELRRNPEPLRRDSGLLIAVTQKAINETEDHLLSETQWLTRMMLVANKLNEVFASMRWHLIEFDEPLLAISDHPVTAWPLEAEYRRPQPTPAGLGVLNFLEVRAPLSPTLALLMTWQDSPDTPNAIQGSEEIAANINAFTIANAERQWMHVPGGSVPIAEGYLDPISPKLIPHYQAAEAKASMIRKKVTDLLEQKLGQSLLEAVDENGQMHAQIVSANEQS